MRVYRFISIAMISMALLAFGIACGGEDPTPTPKPAPTATPVLAQSLNLMQRHILAIRLAGL